MQITITSDTGRVFPLEVGNDLTIRDLQALVELEMSIPQSELLMVHNMAPMIEAMKTVGQYGVEEGDIIMASRVEGGVTLSDPEPPQQPSHPPTASSASGSSRSPAINWGAISLPSFNPNDPRHPHGSNRTQVRGRNQGQQQQTSRDSDDPETVRQHFLNNPYDLSQLQQRNPPLADALLSGDRERFRDALERQRKAVREAERERIRILNADPLDPEYQAKIAQDIRQKNIEENMEAAIEYTPESFSRVVMLYLEIKVNGVAVKALVDSGARSTVMSQACAVRCNIMRLVDRRYAGMAFGVGQQRILGRVHLGQLQIGRDFLTSSFTVLESAAEDMLLGLDMLKRHQCCIDLNEDCLRIGSTGNSATFLTEKDLKEKEGMEKEQLEVSNQAEDFEMAQAIAASESQNVKAEPDPQSTNTAAISTSSLPNPSPTSQPPRPPPSSTSHAHSFPEEAIQRITSVGFSREEAIRELTRTNGNTELALTALLARSIKL